MKHEALFRKYIKHLKMKYGEREKDNGKDGTENTWHKKENKNK